MANPRQRRKTKSSTHKAVSHSKRAKRLMKKMPAIRGPKPLQDAWDASKTVRQNYLALGLQHTLNPISSGGSEVSLNCAKNKFNASPSQSTASSYVRHDGDRPSGISDCPASASGLPKGFGRIVRDSSGAVTIVELREEGEAERTSKQDRDNGQPMSELRIWGQASSEKSSESGTTCNTIVKDLENLAAATSERQRHSSVGERGYLERLAKKYGDDLHKMALDRRLNPEQKTIGELKRAITKAGGLGVLRGDTS
ncbi:hypothetical protein BDN67DRAFT_929241 [Paxillus ammoniavirescens]|nr:hypothetical protein BDN67DRAFT_929241 [Paxillus ammoniavirescens]